MKQFETLYINDQPVDIGDTDITLEWQSVMLSNISKFKCSHSYTIKLPMTIRNRQVFDSVETAQHAELVKGKSAVLSARMTARYYCNGVNLIGDACAYLIGAEDDNYKVVLTWWTLKCLQDIIDEDDNLPDIFDYEDNWHEITLPSGHTSLTISDSITIVAWYQWPTSVISEELGENVMCLQYVNGVLGDDFYDYIYYLPSIKVTYILQRIFDRYGVPYDFSHVYDEKKDGVGVTRTEDLLDSLYVPMVTMNDSLSYQQLYEYTVHITADSVANFWYSDDYKAVKLGNMRDTFVNDDRLIWLIENKHYGSPTVGFMGRFQNMSYKVKVHIRIFICKADIDSKYPAQAKALSTVKLCFINGNSYDSATKLLTLEATYIRGGWYTKTEENGNEYLEMRWEYEDDWEEIEANDEPANDDWKNSKLKSESDDDTVFIIRQGRHLIVDGTVQVLMTDTVNLVPMIDEETSYQLYDSQNNDATPETYDSYYTFRPVLNEIYPYNEDAVDTSYDQIAAPLYIEPNFPDMKPIDFLKGVFYVIGAYPVEKDGVLKIVLYNDLVENVWKAPDWSKFVVGDYDMPSKLDFALSEWSQKNWLNWKSDDQDDPDYSDYFTIENPYLDDEEDVFTLPWVGCKTERGMSKITLYETGEVLSFIKHKKYTTVDKEDGFVFKAGEPTIGVRHAGVVDESSGESGLDYLTFSELSFRTEDGLMNTRYHVIVEMLKYPYEVTCTMEIDEFTLSQLDLSIPVYLRQYNSYFGILSIKRAADGKCTVELIRIPNSLIKEWQQNDDTEDHFVAGGDIVGA